jgi:DNA-binding GntR family transcriptional regulator
VGADMDTTGGAQGSVDASSALQIPASLISPFDGHNGHDRRTAEAFVRETLREAILRGEIPVGSRLLQAEVAQQLAVSTTPVREALRALATEGLVTVDPHRGAVVRGLSASEVRDIHRLRQILEPEVMHRAVQRITAEQIQVAEELQERMREESNPGRWAELNRSFHRVFLHAAGSERLAQLVSSLHDAYSGYIAVMMMSTPKQMQQATDDHDAILAAVRAGDAEAATASVLAHMRPTVDHATEAEPSAP